MAIKKWKICPNCNQKYVINKGSKGGVKYIKSKILK